MENVILELKHLEVQLPKQIEPGNRIGMKKKKKVTHRPQADTTNSSSRKPITLGIFTWTSNLGKTVVNRRERDMKVGGISRKY